MSAAAKDDETPPFKTKGKLVKHKGHWFPIVSFPNDQQFEAIRNFPLNDSDVLVASYQKSGCTLFTDFLLVVYFSYKCGRFGLQISL